MRLTNLAVVVVTLSTIVAAQEVTLPDWADGQKRSQIDWPEKLHGLVQNESKQPVANAHIEVVLKIQLYPPGGGVVEKPIYRRELRTEADGTWSLPTDSFPRVSHRPLLVVVTASAPSLVPWRTYGWYGYSTNTTKGQQQTITLPRGYVVSGQCADESGKPAKGVRFRLSHPRSGIRGEWGIKDYACNEQGEFRLLLPKSGTKALWIYGDSLSPMFKLAPEQATDNIRYELKSGARVMGFVRGTDGKPRPNVAVHAVSKFSGNVPAYAIPFEAAAKTDARGRFRFPPLSGEYKFRLSSAGRLTDGSYFEAPQTAPTMLPITLNLESGREPVILKASKFAVVSGIVRWPDTSPATDTMIAAYAMPKGNGGGLSLGRMMTGKDGRYSFRIPVPLEQFLISADHRSRDGKHFKPVAKSESKSFDCKRDIAKTKLLHQNTTIDFDFVSY